MTQIIRQSRLLKILLGGLFLWAIALGVSHIHHEDHEGHHGHDHYSAECSSCEFVDNIASAFVFAAISLVLALVVSCLYPNKHLFLNLLSNIKEVSRAPPILS